MAEGRPWYWALGAPRAKRVVQESNEMCDLFPIADGERMRRVFHDRDIARRRSERLHPCDPLNVELGVGSAG